MKLLILKSWNPKSHFWRFLASLFVKIVFWGNFVMFGFVFSYIAISLIVDLPVSNAFLLQLFLGVFVLIIFLMISEFAFSYFNARKSRANEFLLNSGDDKDAPKGFHGLYKNEKKQQVQRKSMECGEKRSKRQGKRLDKKTIQLLTMNAIQGIATVLIVAHLSIGMQLYAQDNSLFLHKFFNNKVCDQVLDNDGFFKTCYNYKNKGAKYVAYKLDGQKVYAVNIRERLRFYPDPHIPKQYRANYSDYTRNPYHMDRGHLANDADFDWSYKSLKATYVLSNIIPQYYLINREKEYWAGVERYARYMAYKLGSVNILNGVVYGKNPKRIGRNQIAVPKAFWKMIYNKNKHFKKCFYFENNPVFIKGKYSIKDFLIDCKTLLSNK